MPGLAFQSTLSLRRATDCFQFPSFHLRISIHALLAESDGNVRPGNRKRPISIHALLAESDKEVLSCIGIDDLFQSTLSLRRATEFSSAWIPGEGKFQSTLSLRRATRVGAETSLQPSDFNPRSPCGERLYTFLYRFQEYNISIHALLAESDPPTHGLNSGQTNFNPRSPCGERR